MLNDRTDRMLREAPRGLICPACGGETKVESKVGPRRIICERCNVAWPIHEQEPEASTP